MIDEFTVFDYDEYKEMGFRIKHPGDDPLKLEAKEETNPCRQSNYGRKKNIPIPS